MNEEKLKEIIRKIKKGNLSSEKALDILRNIPYQDLGFAKIDHHRALRKGFPEVVYGEGKTARQVMELIKKIYKYNKKVLVTRIGAETYKKIKKDIPPHYYYEAGRAIRVGKKPKPENKHVVPVLTAGTADIPVAEEARAALEAMGNKTETIYDVGVSGIHRLLDKLGKVRSSRVIIVVAGMDGVLPSIVGGLVNQPVIAVPTSIGYGASFNGIGPLITMLNCCAPGVVVVNINNGFGAGYAASLINSIGKP